MVIGASYWRHGKHKSSSQIDTGDTKKILGRVVGLRKVYPYHFTFTTFTKGRWVGQKILDVFVKEFRSNPAEEYEKSIRDGSLTVNCKKVDVNYCLKHNELLSNTVHRHEVPVTAEPITIVHADKDLVVVNKPASIPVSS
ncbi:hypothetical protein J437_LFUL018353 [Ladona fulva]|uniref:RNA pseudouridylate synthase domain-containing protein 2 n=1 Tax=Ladona fulva TaxID=123851 RepID=A0A8K0KNH0_LADFU|nr:hypothetical protein J437_LFUL018353 [Ladona fulva]